MLISTWLQSFRKRLQPQGRRPNRRTTDEAARNLEHLESRHLLAAPTLVAVRPNGGDFITAGQELDSPPTEITLQFNPGQQIDPATATTSTVSLERAGHDGTFGDGNEVPVSIGYVGIGDTPEEVVMRFAENLPDDYYRITIDGSSATPLANLAGEAFNDGADQQFDFSLDLGARIVAIDPQPVTRESDGSLSQELDKIVLYLNEDDLDPSSAADTTLYQLIFTNDTVSNLDDVHHNPVAAVYDANANTVTLDFGQDIDTLSGAGTYRLRVGTSETKPTAPTLWNPGEPGSSFATADTTLGTFATSGNTSHIISAAIDPQLFPFEFPGANDEPGHREIEVESHLGGAADTGSGISSIDYNFQDVYGFTPQGQPFNNLITDTQKLRAREIFEFYGTLLGIDFRETDTSGLTIVTGDMRALDPTIPTGPGGVAGLAGGGIAIMDQAEIWSDHRGGSWFNVAMHEIGHLLGLGHTYELPEITVQGGNGAATRGSREPDYPGDNDIVHGQHLHRPDSIDIDMYKFDVPVTGLFTAEVLAERNADASSLDSYMRIYRELGDGSRVLVAQNDDYFSEDSYLELLLEPGTYYVGLSSTGNDDYDPTIEDTGIGGTSEGAYDLRVNFRPNITNTAQALVDESGTLFDGDGDGQEGGIYNFWLRATAAADTLFVDKVAAPGGTGDIAAPFQNIDDAFAAAVEGQTVRIVGNGGADNDILTVADNNPYLIGKDSSNNNLEDGSTMNVPKGITVMIDAGAIFKLRQARIGVGSSTTAIDRSGSSLQILGVPGNQVIFTSLQDESIGTDTTSTPTVAAPGQWGGISFRNDIDRQEGRFNYQSEGIFLNYVGQSDIRNGGGGVIVDSVLTTVNPINIAGAQPTITYNTITESADSAMSADPDSFEELTFHSARFQDGAPAFTSGYGRVGPQFRFNTLTDNSTNGLFVRVETAPGQPIRKLTVPGRFDDLDIVHYIAQNLEIQGTAGGLVQDQTPPDVTRVTVNALNRPDGALTQGTYNYQLVFIDANGIESPASAVTLNATVDPAAAQPTNSVLLQQLPPVPSGPDLAPSQAGYVGRRLYRSNGSAGGPYTLVAELDSTSTVYLDVGANLGRTLNAVTQRTRARRDARLSIDPGVIVKLEKSRIEVGIGAQFIAEGQDGRDVIFTSRFDDRYGAGGTFDTNDDDSFPNEAVPAPGNWGGIYIGHMASASIDHALITFAGGQVPNGGDFSSFNAVEIHQAAARIRNTTFESNATGLGGSSSFNRDGLFVNGAGTIFVRAAQPVILDNTFRDNQSAAISINANALNKDFVSDPGRSTGFADQQRDYAGNQGALVRDNRMGGNATNGMVVRGETLTTQGVWDDTDIVHVVRDEIYIPDFHTYGGLRLESSSTESLVVKLQGTTAGFTAGGYPLDIVDRIGGSLQIIGQPGQPVYLTSLADDSIGAGFDLAGSPLTDTNNDGPSTGSPGDWRSVKIEEYAHDRNVKVYVENETDSFFSADTNSAIQTAEVVGLLAERDTASDEFLRLGFEIHGNVDSPDDEDIYSFTGTAGTHVWLDLDRTSNSLDSIVELLDANGNILAFSNDNDAFSQNPTALPAHTLAYSPFRADDLYTLNAKDAGFRVVLPGATGTVQSYFVRVRSSNADPQNVIGGLTSGEYQLQIRLQELDEVPGTQVRYASISYATNGVEIYGQPAHSPLQGESTEFNNTTGVTQVTVGNILNSDRAALSLAGRLETPTGSGTNLTYDIDLWEFEVRYDATQQIAGVALEGPHVPVTIDLDFADGFSRADTTVAVFNSDNELILIGRDSNISDDQPKPLGGAGVSDLDRGSEGKLDPFIGPVELPGGIYRLAVFPTTQTPEVLDQYFNANSSNGLVRLEPVNSTIRVAEERFEPSGLVFDFLTGTFVTRPTDTRATAAAPITDLFTVDTFGDIDPRHVVPFTLGDVTLFVSQNGSTKPGDQTAVHTVDPFTGAIETTLGGFNLGIGDIAMRADGQLHAFSTRPPIGTGVTDGNVGNYLQIDTGTGAASSQGDDGITTQILNTAGNGAAAHDVGIQFNAMAYSGTDNGNDTADLWAIGDRTTNSLKQGQTGFVGAEYTSNILYNLNLASGQVDGRSNTARTGNGGFSARDGAGTPQWEWGFVDTTFNNGGLQGQVTGMVTMDGGSSFYVVDDEGGLYRVDRFASGGQTVDPNSVLQTTFSNTIRTTFIRNIGADETGVGGLDLNFQGLALGPENVEGGLFSQTLFGITSNGDIHAFDTTGELQPVFADGQTSISTGVFSANGLAFGTLDYNLWHITSNRGNLDSDNDGHGYDVATFDDSIALPEAGGPSLAFTFEHGGNTPDPSLSIPASGNKNTGAGNTISNTLNRTFDFPGGAHGSVVSNEFSLEDYDRTDKPALYFSYFLQTEGQDYVPPGALDDPMRDAIRVFVSDESGEWNLISTNDSYQSDVRFDEFDYAPDGGFTQQPTTQSFPDVVETFDNHGEQWRQARIDLSNYAGRAGLQLRFDFSTAGAMDLGNIQTGGYELYAVDAENISDEDGFGLTEIGRTEMFEFDMGAHLIVPTGSALPGEQFDVFGTTFTYTTNATAPEDIEITLADSAETVANKTRLHLNGYFDGTRITLPAGNFLEGESFTINATTFTYTATPMGATDILAEPGDTGETIAFRTMQVVNSLLGSGTSFVDADSVDMPGVTTITFGGTLNASPGFLLEGENFTVLGTTFTYTDTPLLPTDIEITVADTAATVATNTADVVNTVLGAGTAFATSGRVSFPDLPTAADGIFTGGTLYLTDAAAADTFELESFSVLGTTYTFTATPTQANDILAEAGDLASVLATRAQDAINAVSGAGTAVIDPLAPARVTVNRLPTAADSFTRGSTLVLQNIASLERYEFRLQGQTFRFTSNPNATGDILARPADSAALIATRTATQINALFGAGTAFVVNNRVSIPDNAVPSSGIFQGGQLDLTGATILNLEMESFTIFGKTFTYTTSPRGFLPTNAIDIDTTGAATPDVLATLTANAINSAEGFTRATANGAIVDIAGAVSQSFGGSFTLVGPNAAEQNNDSILVNGILLTFVANNPTFTQIQTDNNENITATNAVDTINNIFGAGTAFRVGTTVHIVNATSIQLVNDSNNDNSLVVNDGLGTPLSYQLVSDPLGASLLNDLNGSPVTVDLVGTSLTYDVTDTPIVAPVTSFVTAYVNQNRVTIPSATAITPTFGSPLQASGGAGVSAGATAIQLNPGMSKNEVAIAIRQALADVYAGVDINGSGVNVGDINNIKGHEEMIRILSAANRDFVDTNFDGIITQADVGPLGLANSLPGDTFGAFEDGYINSQAALRPGSLRGMDNAYEGVYIDDIIIGFAERGEMVTNAPANTNFIDNDDVLNPDLPLGQDFLGIVDGAYDVEIRRALDYGVTQDPQPTNVLFRAIDTNDREALGTSVEVPTADQIPHGSTILLSDGIREVTLEFVDLAAASAGSPGTVPIFFDSRDATLGTYNDSKEGVAASLVAAINSQAVQNILTIQATTVNTVGTASRIHLIGNAIMTPDSTLSPNMVFTHYDDIVQAFTGVPLPILGDQNHKRDQGQIIIESSFITDSANYGIIADAADRGGPNGLNLNPTPHAGSVRNTQEINTSRQVTGVVLMNNVIALNDNGGILLSGDTRTDPLGPVPFARVVNNTIVGDGDGVGILVEENSAPTLINNILVDLNFGINVDGSSASGTVLGANLFQNNTTHSNVAGNGTFPLILANNEPLFVDKAVSNYYLAPNSRAIDSSLKSLADRIDLIRVKDPLGIGVSPILAPELDVYGQLRSDDPDVATPDGQGANVFLDRGAIDRADFFEPTAVMSRPEDQAGNDLDGRLTYVWVNEPNDLRRFIVRLSDAGIGIDDAVVNSAQFTLLQEGTTLVDGTDYVWSYNSVTGEVIFTAVTIFPFETNYEIRIDNTAATGVRDLAGNPLAANRADGTTVFELLVTDGINDPPINVAPLRQTILEDATLTFNTANNNRISVSDADVHLGNNRLQVTVSVDTGVISLSGVSGLTFTTGDGTADATITFEGDVADVNAALDGMTYTPSAEYFNILPTATPPSATPVLLTIATDDLGQFTGPPSTPQVTTSVVRIDVVAVNDPPTFDPLTNPPATDEDTGPVSIIGFVTNGVPGPATESAQTITFTATVTGTTSNLAFTATGAPAINPAGDLTYEFVGDTNGVATVEVIATDSDGAVSAADTFEITVNPVNDEPIFTLVGLTQESDEDDGVVGPIDLASSFAAGPATATDEIADQTPTFQTTSPVVTDGNLVFTQFAVSADGKLTYEAAANTAGTATFDIWLVDDGPTTHPLDDNQADALTITVTVNAQPDPPVPSTPNYVIDLGDALNLDASATTDPDLEFPGPPTEELLYSWDLNGDSVFDLVDLTTSQTTVSAVDLANLNLTVPGVNNITLQVTDTYAGTSATTTATLTIHTVDYGDAPDANYGTLKPNGAAHTFVDGFHLGATIDTELDGQADDGADEDGIVFDPGMQADGSFALESFFMANASAAGKLDIWIDFNNDGDFDPAEHLNGGTSYDLVAGDNTFNFTIAAGAAVTGVDTYARARFSSAGSLAPTGRADDGEVEDYQFQISPLLDATEVTHVLPMWSQTSDLTPLLQWQDSAGTPAGANVTYNIELRNASDQVVGFEEGHTSQSISLSDPLPPGVYTAYVTAFNRAGEAGPISQLDTFEVVAIAVTSPTGNQTNGLPPITFTPIDKTDHYELQIQSALTGATVFEDLNVPGTASSYTLASELPIGEYRSRVRAIEDTTGQVGDWSAFSQFAVRTAPVITAPIGTIADATPTVTWNSVPGAATYDVRITNITDATSPQIIAGVAGLTVDVTQVLPLGEYTVEVRGVTGEGYQAAWTTAETFVVAIPPVISQPGGRLPDSTPTIAWSAVNGADHYDIEIVNTVTSQVAYELLAVTGTQHTVPAASSLPLGNYEVRVKASNVPAASSTGSTVSVLSLPATFTVSTPPEILTPAVGIYDSTPEFTWTEATGAVSTEIEIRDFVNNNVVFTQAGITGTSFTIPAGSALPPGGYEARIRSYGDAAGTVLSDWSTLHVFQIGAAPVAHGPTEGIGQPDFRKTNSPRPTLTAQQSLAGVTFEFWLTDVMAGKTVTVARNLTSSSWTVPTDLPVGRYRYWVRATTDLGEQSPWSAPFDFEVTTPPVMNPIGPTFNPRPTFSWNSQPEIDTYQVWINKVDVVPAQIIRIEDGVVGTSYQLPEDLPNGRYKVWTRGSVTGENGAGGTTVTTWSNGETFEVGGRPQVVPIGNTSDNTPLISWSEVAGRSTFELYLAEQGSEGTPVIRVNDLTTTSYQVTGALNSGEWIVWVRAKSADGRVSPWSTTAQGRFSVNAATTPVVDAIPTSNDRTPTFNWTSATGAARYEIYVSPKGDTQNPVIRVDTITATTYTPTTPLAPGTYRVWVRAINAANATGNWSTVVEFTITANVNQRVAGDQPDVMLTSVDPTVNEFQQEDVTISLIPARVVEDSGRSVHPAQANVSNDSAEVSIEVPATEPSLVAETDEAAIANSDSVMSNWDDAIWAEESAAPTVGSPQVAEVTTETPSEGAKGWMAGLALLTPSLRRRRRQKKD